MKADQALSHNVPIQGSNQNAAGAHPYPGPRHVYGVDVGSPAGSPAPPTRKPESGLVKAGLLAVH